MMSFDLPPESSSAAFVELLPPAVLLGCATCIGQRGSYNCHADHSVSRI